MGRLPLRRTLVAASRSLPLGASPVACLSPSRRLRCHVPAPTMDAIVKARQSKSRSSRTAKGEIPATVKFQRAGISGRAGISSKTYICTEYYRGLRRAFCPPVPPRGAGTPERRGLPVGHTPRRSLGDDRARQQHPHGFPYASRADTRGRGVTTCCCNIGASAKHTISQPIRWALLWCQSGGLDEHRGAKARPLTRKNGRRG